MLNKNHYTFINDELSHKYASQRAERQKLYHDRSPWAIFWEDSLAGWGLRLAFVAVITVGIILIANGN